METLLAYSLKIFNSSIANLQPLSECYKLIINMSTQAQLDGTTHSRRYEPNVNL